jgi:hypothetical protein
LFPGGERRGQNEKYETKTAGDSFDHPGVAISTPGFDVNERHTVCHTVKAERSAALFLDAAYMLSIEDIKEFPKYEKRWKEIFQLR